MVQPRCELGRRPKFVDVEVSPSKSLRRQVVKGFITRKPLWLAANLAVAMIRREVEMMEEEARNFYQAAIAQTSDAAVRQLLGDLAAEESKHYDLADKMDEQQKASGATNKESESERRRFVLQIVQPASPD